MKYSKRTPKTTPQRLFIIGNGFDLMHKLKTSYNNFRTFLTNYAQYSGDSSLSKSSAFFVDFFDKHSRGTNWNDIEENLLNIAFDVDDLVREQLREKHNIIDIENCLLHIYFDFTAYLLDLTQLFNEWVNGIKIDTTSINLDFRALAEHKPSAFLNFNYTPVLENIYNLKNVCHIHGKQGGKIVLGHCGDLNSSVDYWLLDEVYGGLSKPFGDLKKETEKYIFQNEKFFNQSPYWREIYSYGFSFSKVDIPYVLEICKKTDTSSIWYLSDYEGMAIRESFKQIIRDCGFRGFIDVFHIEQQIENT